MITSVPQSFYSTLTSVQGPTLLHELSVVMYMYKNSCIVQVRVTVFSCPGTGSRVSVERPPTCKYFEVFRPPLEKLRLLQGSITDTTEVSDYFRSPDYLSRRRTLGTG